MSEGPRNPRTWEVTKQIPPCLLTLTTFNRGEISLMVKRRKQDQQKVICFPQQEINYPIKR